MRQHWSRQRCTRSFLYKRTPSTHRSDDDRLSPCALTTRARTRLATSGPQQPATTRTVVASSASAYAPGGHAMHDALLIAPCVGLNVPLLASANGQASLGSEHATHGTPCVHLEAGLTSDIH